MFKGLARLLVLLFTAGTILLTFFVLLGSIKSSGVLAKFWWLQADTSGISNAADVSQWSLWGICERSGTIDDSTITSCSNNKPAFPFDPERNFDNDSSVPDEFRQHSSQLYYQSRFLFPFFTIGLFFEVLVFLGALFTVFRPLWAIVQIIHLLGWAFLAAAASLATVTFVRGRDYFQNAGYEAKLGKYLLGFVWAAVFMTMLNVLLLCCTRPTKDNSGSGSGKKSKKQSENSNSAYGAGGYASEPRGSYRFGVGSRKTTAGGADAGDADRSSYVHV